MPRIHLDGCPPSEAQRAVTSRLSGRPARSTPITSFGERAAAVCISLPKARKSLTGWPLTLRMRSPPCMPACAAGSPGMTVAATAGGGASCSPSSPRYLSTDWPDGSRFSGSSSCRGWPSLPRTLSGSGVRASRAFATASIASLQVVTARPSTPRMRSPGWMPAAAAMLCGAAVTTGATSGRPSMNISQNAASVKIRLNPGPAATMAMRCHTGLPVNSCARSAGSTSPSRASSILT